MNSSNPGRWINQLVGWCFGILAAVITLYCAVKVLEAIWPALIVVVGVITLVGLVVGAAIVVFRTLRNRW